MPSHHGVGEKTGRSFPNDTLRLLIERSSCRSFENKKIPPDVLDLVLESGIHAATGGNLQPYSIIKIENQTTKDKLTKLVGDQPFVSTAPVDLLFCIDYHRLERWAKLETAPYAARSAFRHFWIGFQDTIIAAQNICTAADALDLGSVYVGTVMECFRELREMFELPEGVFPVVLLCLGYPKVRPEPRKKLGVPVMVHDEKYRELTDADLLAAFNQKYSGWKKEITVERLETIEYICREVHGDAFAEECVAKIKRQGHVNAVQNYFGLHYMASIMAADNDEFMAIMEEFGCHWFKKFEPKKTKDE